MGEIVFKEIILKESDVITEWFWVRRMLPISFQQWMEFGPALKQQARQLIEPCAVIEF